MIELDLTATRGSLPLEIKCTIGAPWTVIFGPSGAGKTTLLRLIAGLDKPDSGVVHLQTPSTIGMVSQQPLLFPNMTVRTNVAYGIAHLPTEAQRKQISSVLELVGATHLIDRLPTSLSGGEAQRVSLARTLARTPNVLLLDEPLSALDAAARDQLLSRLQAWLKDKQVQTILVTHDASDALTTEAEVLRLHQGKLIAQGKAIQVLAAERMRLLARLTAIE